MHTVARKSKGDAKGQRARRAARKRQWWAELKAQYKCACGESNPACIDFHHLNPADKLAELSDLVSQNSWRKAAIMAELAKCIALCANCHRKVHAQ